MQNSWNSVEDLGLNYGYENGNYLQISEKIRGTVDEICKRLPPRVKFVDIARHFTMKMRAKARRRNTTFGKNLQMLQLQHLQKIC